MSKIFPEILLLGPKRSSKGIRISNVDWLLLPQGESDPEDFFNANCWNSAQEQSAMSAWRSMNPEPRTYLAAARNLEVAGGVGPAP